MRIEGGSQANGSQPPQSRFEQVMSRELARAGGGKTPAETSARTKPVTGSADSKKRAPGSERVGVRFESIQAGKILKGMQDSTRQALLKTMTFMAEMSKTTFAKLSISVDTAFGKAQAFSEKAAGTISVKMGGTAAKGEAALIATPKESASTQTTMKGDAPVKGGSLSTATATTTTTTAPASTPITTRGGEAQVIAAGSERTAAPTALMDTVPTNTSTTPNTTEAPGAQEGRVALAVQESPHAHEGILMHGPHLQAAMRRANAAGKTLSMVYQLGENAHGAEFVSIASDDTGIVSGPGIDIALNDGGIDTAGNWAAQAGQGKLDGAEVTLEPDADGCVFVTDGEAGVAQHVTMWIAGSAPLHTEIIAIQKFGS